ncbi:peroxisomal membrane protein 2 [Candoia aspera]|uniref:peroxisomal membrane protein 2 n=1 Tax=Candoia aspera TaxID=51853 RepID=UPI002FD7BD2D
MSPVLSKPNSGPLSRRLHARYLLRLYPVSRGSPAQETHRDPEPLSRRRTPETLPAQTGPGRGTCSRLGIRPEGGALWAGPEAAAAHASRGACFGSGPRPERPRRRRRTCRVRRVSCALSSFISRTPGAAAFRSKKDEQAFASLRKGRPSPCESPGRASPPGTERPPCFISSHFPPGTRGRTPFFLSARAFLSALGSLLSQVIGRSQKKRSFDWQEPLQFAVYGFLFTGPHSHYFYLHLEQRIPSDASFALLRCLLVDHLIVSPVFVALFFLVMNVLEGKGMSAFSRKMKSGYWAALKMNWKVWTPVQVINFTYVPLQFQVLFGNFIALLWFAYLASIKK